ncbi:MAG: hypothetical protein KBF73_06965 [Flavobacteriales bacterium]|nr:hypothetical protein [Flavobacteriales bacterium]
MKHLNFLFILSFLIFHNSVIGQPSSTLYSYTNDNFSIRFESDPNVSATNSKSTYSVTSLRDTVIYRIIVDTDVDFTVDTVKKVVVIRDFLNEWVSYLDSLGMPHEKVPFRGTNAVISRGEMVAMGFMVNLKTIAFMKFNRFYTISVVGFEESLEGDFQAFIENFQFLRN